MHAWRFELNENLLDQADLAAEADQPFASEDWVLAVESLDGRTRREWRFFLQRGDGSRAPGRWRVLAPDHR
ncbi:DUF5629 family protein, partial [Acinetobacter baumannii]|uniref:DUF5629 family protein n=1 Tax=Acinetobacter baumannii TaxID=470 RepID=UPI00338F025A